MKQQLFTTDDAVSTACAVNTKHRGRLLAMAAGILSVLILLVTAMQFVISAGADRYSEYSNSCRKYMMAFMKNDSTYSQLVNATRLPYRNYVESLQRDQGFLNSLTAWKAANLDLSGGVSEITQSAEYKYYLGILMDLMTDTVNETDLLDAANAYMDALHISLAKQSVNTLKKYNELSMKVDKEDSETLLNEIGMLEEASDVLDLIGDIGNVIEKANDLGDLIDKISQLCAIHDLTKGYSEVMRFMCDACDSENIALKSALAYMRDVTSGALTEEMASAILTGQTVADDALKSVLGAVKKSVLSVMGYGGTVISFAQSLSKYVANQLFATDNIQSAFYKSRALYDIEDLLRLALKGTSSADRFFAAFSLYENVMYKGADYSVSYYKAVYEDSIFGKVFAWIQGNGDAASKFKSMMSDEKDRLKVSFDNLQRRAYNGYKGLAHTSEVGNLNVRQEYIIPDLSDLVENDAQLNKLSIETYGLPDEDYTLTEDMTLYANVYHSNGTIDLNGHSLTILGDLVLEGGCVKINGGQLNISGDYNAAIPVTNSDGTTGYNGGYLDMGNVNDKVSVSGDFNTCIDYIYDVNGYSYLNNGVLEIGGNLNDFYNRDSSYSYRGLCSKGTKFIFNGTGNQIVTAADGLLSFKNIEFNNSDITFKNTEITCYIEKDETVNGDLYIREIDLKGHKLTVNGNLQLRNKITLNGGELYINGDYNAVIPVKNNDGTTGYIGGYLNMNNVNDKVSVSGDFNTCIDYIYDVNGYSYLNKGVLEIGGNLNDFYNRDGSYSYRGLCSKGTKFIFNGTGEQTITATDGYICFKDVDFVDTENRELVINCEISADLCSDTYITGDATVCGNLNGHLLNVSGNLTVNNSINIAGGDIIVEEDLYSYGNISLNGGHLIVDEDYNAYKATTNKDGTITYSNGGYLYMGNVADRVIVNGNFSIYSNYEYYNGNLVLGSIEVKGNLNDYYNDGLSRCGLYSYGTKFIFSGTGKQTITALDGKLVLNTAEFVNKDVQIDCSTDIDVEVPVRVHDYSDEWTVDVEAACNDGSKSHHCTRCDAKTDITVIPGNGHTVVIDAAVAPSCTEPGLTEGSHCSVCNTVIKAQETVPATGHDFENGICKNCNMDEAMTIQSKHPYDNSCDETWTIHRDGATRIDVTFTDETYTESGYDYIYIYDGDDKLIGKYSGSELSGKTISVNSDTVKIRLTSDSSNTQYGFALDKIEYSTEALCDHSNTEIRNAKSAGCTTEGYTGDTYCKDCGEKISSGEVISAKGHTEVTDKAVDATCTKTGLTEGIHCSVCNTVIKAQEVVPAKGHTEVVDKAVAATCTKTGLTEGKHCSVCDAVIKAQETVPATGKHSFGDWKITKAATCTAEGTQTRTCSGCGKVETQTIAKVAHKYVNTVVKPTYTAQGYTLHKCSVCGTSYKDTYTAKLTLAKVTGVKLAGRAADALRVNWTKNANASGYIVEMYQGNKWVRVAKITSNATTTYRASGLKASTVYKFRVKAYKMSGKTAVYSAYSTELAARTNPSVMTGAKLSGRAADALRINWTKNTTADGYIVEMYKGSKWVRAAKITSNSTTTFRKAGLKASTVYKFRVRAYKMSGKAALYGNYSATVTARTNPSVMTGVKIAGKAKDALRVNWTKNTSAQGYIVEMYKGGKWVRVAKITNGNTTTFRKAGLAKNTAYKFRVCAYYMSGKTALYGNYGSVSGKTAAK